MTKSREIAILLGGVLLLACQSDFQNTSEQPVNEEWQELRCGLWINAQGQLAFKTYEAMDTGEQEDVYLTYIGWGDTLSLNEVVDTNTFHSLGGDFYLDKNRIYNHYWNSDGGYLNILEAHYESFQVLGPCYAKDKDRIYLSQGGALDSVDYDSFITTDSLGCMARDKNGFIYMGERMDENEPGAIERMEEFNRLTMDIVPLEIEK